MALKLITAPAEEPVTLAEARLHLRMPSNETGQDSRILSCLAAARELCEDITHRRFVTQTWDWYLDAFPDWCIEVPGAPLQSVTSIKYLDTSGVEQTLAGSSYIVDVASEPGRITPAYGSVWPSTQDRINAVTVRIVCGYGLAPAVPRRVREAMLLMLGDLYEHREDSGDFETFRIPRAAEDWLAPLRLVRF